MDSKIKSSERRKMQIFYTDESDEVCSIIQVMSKRVLGSWIWHFLDNGFQVVKVEEIID